MERCHQQASETVEFKTTEPKSIDKKGQQDLEAIKRSSP
jgi:hypothetical protein